jgi:hypothetical protein
MARKVGTGTRITIFFGLLSGSNVKMGVFLLMPGTGCQNNGVF